MGKDGNYNIIYRGEQRDYIALGRRIFVQRAKEVDGGFWLAGCGQIIFELGLEQPKSLSNGLAFLNDAGRVAALPDWDDDFKLEG